GDELALDTWPLAIAVGACGLVLLVVSPWVCSLLAQGHARLARVFLGSGAATARLGELTRSRAAAVDAQTVELRRIERDLHDGAQARLLPATIHPQARHGAPGGSAARRGAPGGSRRRS